MLYDYAASPILMGVWGEVLLEAPKPACGVEIFDSSGCALKISLGPVGQEDSFEVPYTITPNGSAIFLPIEVARGKRISVQPIDDDADVGLIIINFFG